MTQFTADTGLLKEHGDLHAQIAQYYAKVYKQLTTQGNTIVHDLHNSDCHEAATTYQHWMDTLTILVGEANIHQAWADYLRLLAQIVNQLEQSSS
jgi:UDP-N-acetylmuramoylalanine-D-glutamate ligase